MIINESTSQFIDHLGKQNPDLQEIIKDEIELADTEKINSIIENSNQQLEEVFADVDKKIDQILEELPPDPSTSQVIELLQRATAVAEEKLQEKTKIGQKGYEAADYLTHPLLGLSLGIRIAGKMQSQLSTELEASLLTTDVSRMGTGIVALGFKCYAIQKNGDFIRKKKEEKEALVQLAQKEHDPKKIKEIHSQIEALSHEIDDLQKLFHDDIKEVTKDFFFTSFRGSANALEIVANSSLIELHSTLIENLLIASSDLSLAGSLVSLGWYCYEVAQHASHLSRTKNKIRELEELHKTLGPDDVYIACIIQAKLQRLSNVKLDYQYSLGSKIVNMCASSLALAAATNTALIAASVSVGAMTSLVLTATGGAGIALIGGTAAAGMGVAAYQNRYEIEHVVKSIPIESQRLIVKTQLRLIEKTYKEIKQKLKLLELHQLEIQKKLEAIQENPLPTEKNRKKIIAQMYAAELENKKNFQQMNHIMDEMNKTLEEEKDSTTKIKALRKELASLEKRKLTIDHEKKAKNLRKKFKYIQTGEMIKKTIEEGLSIPSTREGIRRFLLSQKFPVMQDFSPDTVLEYVLSAK